MQWVTADGLGTNPKGSLKTCHRNFDLHAGHGSYNLVAGLRALDGCTDQRGSGRVTTLVTP